MTVTAICPTRDRVDFLRDAIKCFLAQTYKDSQLLILDNSETPEPVLALLREEFPESIFGGLISRLIYQFVPALPYRMNTGQLRNLGCLMASGRLICHVDDDDIASPVRIAEQVQALQESGKAVTGYSTLKFTDGVNWWKPHYPNFAFGTSLMYTRDWWVNHRFPDIPIGEDNDFVTRAWSLGELHTVDVTRDNEPRQTEGDRIVVRMHAKNTSPKVPQANWMKLQ